MRKSNPDVEYAQRRPNEKGPLVEGLYFLTLRFLLVGPNAAVISSSRSVNRIAKTLTVAIFKGTLPPGIVPPATSVPAVTAVVTISAISIAAGSNAVSESLLVTSLISKANALISVSIASVISVIVTVVVVPITIATVFVSIVTAIAILGICRDTRERDHANRHRRSK
jgi:hypothetical protein